MEKNHGLLRYGNRFARPFAPLDQFYASSECFPLNKYLFIDWRGRLSNYSRVLLTSISWSKIYNVY